MAKMLICKRCGAVQWIFVPDEGKQTIVCDKCKKRGEEEETAHDLLVELVEVVKAIPAEFTDDFDDLGDRIKIYLEGGEV